MPAKRIKPKPEQVSFLFQSYSNTQQSIQFFDTKAGAYIAGNGIAVSLLLNNILPYLSELIQIDNKLLSSNLIILVNFILFILLFLALWCLYETMQVFLQSFSVISPKSGINLVLNSSDVNGLFWVLDIKNFVEKHSVAHYAKTMSSLSTKDIVEELAYETVKISYIASVKIFHLGNATKHLRKTIILWVVSLLFVGISRLLFQFLNLLT